MSDFEKEFYKSEIARLKMELETEKNNAGMTPQMQSDIQEIVDIASEMRTLLNECRYEQINMNLAKKIDNLLKRASQFD